MCLTSKALSGCGIVAECDGEGGGGVVEVPQREQPRRGDGGYTRGRQNSECSATLMFSVPSLYLGPWMEAGPFTTLVMRAAAAVAESDMKTVLPAVPCLSWIYFGGRRTPRMRGRRRHHARAFSNRRADEAGALSVVAAPGYGAIVGREGCRHPLYRFGGRDCSRENETMIDWLKRGADVPAACL